MGRMKENFIYWQENVATEEELQLPDKEQLRLAAEWQQEYYEWLDDNAVTNYEENV